MTHSFRAPADVNQCAHIREGGVLVSSTHRLNDTLCEFALKKHLCRESESADVCECANLCDGDVTFFYRFIFYFWTVQKQQ